MRVLLVGADPQVAAKVDLAVRLRWPDAQVLLAADVEGGLEIVEQQDPDVLLFQPGTHGWHQERFIQELRAFSEVPLVVLEGDDAGELDEVKALETGADEYIRRTASVVDLVARLVALVRRVQRSGLSSEQVVSSGGLVVDPASYEVQLHGRRLTLTFTEFRLLHILVKNHGNVLTHDALSRSLWGDQVDSSALVKKYVQRLRRKLGDGPQDPHWIVNVHGIGYRFHGAGEREAAEAPASV